MHEFRIWAPRAQKLRLQIDGREPFAMEGPGRKGLVVCLRPGRGPEHRLRLSRRRRPQTPIPIHAARGSPTACTPSLASTTSLPSSGPRATGTSPPLSAAIIYEMHIGTFSEQGTFDSAIEHLDYLVDLGITHLEIMPINEFAGRRGWGYDGVFLFAPFEPYGGPDGFKRFVNACHARNLAVVLDVVYNHFGPVGNYTNKFAPLPDRSLSTHRGEQRVNFNESGSDEVRRFFCDNTMMWLKDYHVDGLRLDATHEFIDRSAIHRHGAALGRGRAPRRHARSQVRSHRRERSQ